MITLQEMSMLSTLLTQPHRTYHNIYHINNCLAELENFPGSKDFSYRDRQIVEKAIWYHDAVYNPYSKENEARSASLLLVNGHFDYNGEVEDAILATAKHTITQSLKDKDSKTELPLPIATQVMLDIDLAGFGKSLDVCLNNAANIRAEYYNTPELDFQQGRLKFLEAIMKRESLYYTDYFKDLYHNQSQANLKFEYEETLREIQDLTK